MPAATTFRPTPSPTAGSLSQWLPLAGLAMALLLPLMASAEPLTVQAELERKARQIHCIISFVRWDENTLPPGSPLTLGIFGEMPQRAYFEKALAKRKLSRALRIISITTAEEAQHCQVLYLANANGFDRAKLLEAVAEHGVLSIGEFREEPWPECTVELVLTAGSGNEKAVRIDLNLPSAVKAYKFDAAFLAYVARQSGKAGK